MMALSWAVAFTIVAGATGQVAQGKPTCFTPTHSIRRAHITRRGHTFHALKPYRVQKTLIIRVYSMVADYGRWSLILSPASLWSDAEAFCQSQGGNLASVHSFEEGETIASFMRQ